MWIFLHTKPIRICWYVFCLVCSVPTNGTAFCFNWMKKKKNKQIVFECHLNICTRKNGILMCVEYVTKVPLTHNLQLYPLSISGVNQITCFGFVKSVQWRDIVRNRKPQQVLVPTKVILMLCSALSQSYICIVEWHTCVVCCNCTSTHTHICRWNVSCMQYVNVKNMDLDIVQMSLH